MIKDEINLKDEKVCFFLSYIQFEGKLLLFNVMYECVCIYIYMGMCGYLYHVEAQF